MRTILASACLLAVACGGDDGSDVFGGGTAGNDETVGGPGSADDDDDDDDDGATAQVDETGELFDVGGFPDGGGMPPSPTCQVVDDMDAVGECEVEAPPDSFEPDVQWAWEGDGAERYSFVTPLVANLTDDNGDDYVDLCDTPDVVVVMWTALFGPAHIHVLDGETGVPHFRIDAPVDQSVCPAIGDIDGDGTSEIVSVQVGGKLIAFENDGTPKWLSETPWGGSFIGALSLADVDNDGDVEIIAGNLIYDHEGALVTNIPQIIGYGTTTAADLDDDGDLEVVFGHAAYHHDGTLMWNTPINVGFPAVGNLDADPEPEVLVTNDLGLALIDHDGTLKYENMRPTGDPEGDLTWFRPATIHDFDGDGQAEYAMSSGNHYTVYEGDASILWSAPVVDLSGIAAGTAFDFLGDGVAEAMYGDEQHMFVFGDDGGVLLQAERQSRTSTEYPVVADVDNDGSAEIVVISDQPIEGGPGNIPPVQLIRDVEDRWIQARRIWNQHTYHVTNVREDGTIPQVEPHHWELLNTFRTNAQIEGGSVCDPRPEG
jgi:hypothetical protein